MSLLELLRENLTALPAAALAAWLGKIWAERIARKETAEISTKVEGLRHALQLQQDLTSQLQRQSMAEKTAITARRFDALGEFWRKWIDLRKALGKFYTPFMSLKPDERGNVGLLKVLSPYDKSTATTLRLECLEMMAEIEKHRPFLPVAIYQHYKGLSILYMRLSLKWIPLTEASPQGIEPWFKDKSGAPDLAVSAIRSYSGSEHIDLPDPSTSTDEAKIFAQWVTTLEDGLAKLILDFIDGTPMGHVEIHKAIRDLSAEQVMRRPS